MEFSELESFVFKVIAAWSVFALALTCVAVLLGRRQVGRSLHVVRGNRTGRNVVRGICLLAFVWALFSGTLMDPLVFVSLGIAFVVSFVAPGVEDMVLGEEGARHGWQARSFKHMEGWRLVGSHLRFLVHGELVAVEVPPAMMEELRTKLAERCASTENALGSAGERDAPISDG